MNYQKGFNLIELLVSVAVVGIIAAAAIPSYNGYVQNTRRADAKAVLITIANAMERSFSANNTYQNLADGGANTGTPAASLYVIPPALADHYDFAIAAATSTTFTLTATPKAGQVNDPCGMLTIYDTGGTEAEGAGGCW